MKQPIEYIDIRFSVHATENSEKVESAAGHFFPGFHINEIGFRKKILKGHYGNQIKLYQARIKTGKIIEAFIKRLSADLQKSDRETIYRDSNLLVERNNLFLRLDKQAAFKGIVRRCKYDPIHIRIHFKRKNVIEICKELGVMQ
ncbi:MAG: hypothetical protein JSV05_07605 [Candidatus Bathyarchaeota archaeon]|nr:MAG: hypothetical protein JSV05_07605 [Candidatus Bathyarchaeota archaeon]